MVIAQSPNFNRFFLLKFFHRHFDIKTSFFITTGKAKKGKEKQNEASLRPRELKFGT